MELIDVQKIERYDITNFEDLYDNNILDSEFLLYRNECRRITKSNAKILLKNWNGLDYYTNIDISDNFKLKHNDINYPTIDHKISVYYGFINKIDAKLIGNIENLCITIRSINSSKRDLCEDKFNSNFNI